MISLSRAVLYIISLIPGDCFGWKSACIIALAIELSSEGVWGCWVGQIHNMAVLRNEEEEEEEEEG